jgi:hypothetical protein
MPKIIINAIPAFLILLIAEAIAGAILRRDLYDLKDTAASLTLGIGNVIVGLFSKAMIFAFFYVPASIRHFYDRIRMVGVGSGFLRRRN